MAFGGFLLLLFCGIANSKSLKGDEFCEDRKNVGKSCSLKGQLGFCFDSQCTIMAPTPRRLIIKIRYPINNSYAQNSSVDLTKMYVRGNSLGLSWFQGKQMRYTQKDTWEYELEFSIPGLELPSDKKPPAKLEFRVFLADSKDMLGANFVLLLPLSTNTKNASKTPVFTNYPWFFSKEGTVKKRRIYSPQLDEDRLIYVNTPASFDENTYKRYETLIVNDGQNLERILPQLGILMVKRALIKEVLVVGIVNAYENRTRLLAVTNGSDVVCKDGSSTKSYCNGCLNCTSPTCGYLRLVDDYQRCYRWETIPKVYGQLYLDFIQDTVIPECQSSYRALEGASNYGIMGYSLGGLVSCHAIWTRPQTFGSAACMSPSLWWPFPENSTFPDDAVYEFTTSTLLKHRGTRPRQKIYIDVGAEEGYLMIAPAKNASEILAASPYFEMDENLWFFIWDGQYHEYWRAIQRMWIPLIAFYGTEGSPRAEIKKLVENDDKKNKTNSAGRNTFMSLACMCVLGHVVFFVL